MDPEYEFFVTVLWFAVLLTILGHRYNVYGSIMKRKGENVNLSLFGSVVIREGRSNERFRPIMRKDMHCAVVH